MSTIPVSLTENEFNEYINPYLSKARRGFVCKIALYKVFNYILYRLHTGCQWDQLPIERHPHDPKKRNQLGCGLLSLSQMVMRWQLEASLAE